MNERPTRRYRQLHRPKLASRLDLLPHTDDLAFWDTPSQFPHPSAEGKGRSMKRCGRRLTLMLVVALTGCGSVGAAMPEAATTTASTATSTSIPVVRPAEPRPNPAARGTLAYVLNGDVYVAHQDGSHAIKIAD